MANKEQKSSKTLPKAFTSNDICRIIKIAKKQGVASLQVGDFSVAFHEQPLKISKGADRKSGLPKVTTVPLTASKPVAADTEKALVLQDKRLVEEIRRTQMLMDDPVAFEEAEIDAAITGEPSGNDGYNEEEIN